MRQKAQFNNKTTELGGHSFSSKLEASVYQLLSLRVRAGEIASIQVQDHVTVCGPPGHPCKKPFKYIVDFKCTKPDGAEFWVEAKGYPDDLWPKKKIMWAHYGQGPLEIWLGPYQRPTLDEIITPESGAESDQGLLKT